MDDETIEPTPYERFGGEEFFAPLVAGFYARVAADPELRPMYPEEDLAPAERRLLLFLMQYWGGPKTYGDERGHPRLRMRHAPFTIDDAARDRWLKHMGESLDDVAREQGLSDDLRTQLWSYLMATAATMVNQPQSVSFGEARSATDR